MLLHGNEIRVAFSLENPTQHAIIQHERSSSSFSNVMEFNDETRQVQSLWKCNKKSELMSTQQWRVIQLDRERKKNNNNCLWILWVTGNSLSVMEALQVRANGENYCVYIQLTLPSLFFCIIFLMSRHGIITWRNRMTVFRNFVFWIYCEHWEFDPLSSPSQK
jgi:hypothetical protein